MSKLGLQILEEIQKHTKVKLPKYGIVAGQAVAECFFRIKNIPIYTRIKDIDLFFVYNEENKLYNYLNDNEVEDIRYMQKKFNMNFHSYKIEKSKNSSGLEFKYLAHTDVRIVTNFDYENINFVGINYFKTDFLKDTVNNFDINMVQIGVCLNTGKVYKSPEFENFLKSRQVEIIKYSRPVASLLRIIQKGTEFKGIYFNIDDTIRKSILALKLFKLKNDDKIKELNQLIKNIKEKNNSKKHVASIKDLNPDILDILDLEKKIHNRDILDLEKKIFKLRNYNNNTLLNKFENLSEDIKKKLYYYFNIEFKSFYPEKIFNLKPFNKHITPNEIIDNIISKNNLDIHNNKFTIFCYYNKELNSVLTRFKIIDPENRRDKYILNVKDPLIKRYPHILENLKKIQKDNRFKIDINQKTNKFYMIDNNFKYNSYIKNLRNYESTQTHVSYKEKVDLVKFSLRNKKELKDINYKFNLFKKYFYSKKTIKREMNLNLSNGIINKDLINFILKNDIENFLKLKINNKKDIYQKLIRYFIALDSNETYNDIKKTTNYDLEACLRHPNLAFNLYNNKDLYTGLTLNYIGKKIRFFEKKYIFMIGLFESNRLPMNLFFEKEENLENIIKDLLSKQDSGSQAIIIPENIISDSIENKSLFYAKQIITKIGLLKTGGEMKHCVGGHYPELIKGKACFFDIYYKKIRYTLKTILYQNELNGIKELRLRELKGRFNKEPSKEVYKAVNNFIKQLNKNYSF